MLACAHLRVPKAGWRCNALPWLVQVFMPVVVLVLGLLVRLTGPVVLASLCGAVSGAYACADADAEDDPCLTCM